MLFSLLTSMCWGIWNVLGSFLKLNMLAFVSVCFYVPKWQKNSHSFLMCFHQYLYDLNKIKMCFSFISTHERLFSNLKNSIMYVEYYIWKKSIKVRFNKLKIDSKVIAHKFTSFPKQMSKHFNLQHCIFL